MPEEPLPEEALPVDTAAIHLPDEALNAVLDGESGADDAAHAHACARCAARLEGFRQVARAVAGPVAPVAAEHRRAAVSRALTVGLGTEVDESGAAEDDGAVGTVEEGEANPRVATVTVLAEHPRRRWARGAGWAAAAAGVAALALAVPLLDRFPALPSGQDTAASSARERADAGGSTAALGSVDGGDLGDLDRAGFAALVERLDHDLGPGPVEEQASRALDQPDEAEPSEGAAPALGVAEDAPPPGEPAPTAERCEAAARERDPDHGSLVYVARARFEGILALILGFDRPGAPTGRPAEILVLAAGDCTQLASAPA